jgi:hypothetical protein
MISLSHPIKDFLTSAEISELFYLSDRSLTQKFNTYCSRLDGIAASRYNEKQTDENNKLKHDLFELFVEFLIKYKNMASDYRVVSKTEYPEYNVNGIGKAANSRIAIVQITYRQAGNCRRTVLAHDARNLDGGDFEHFELQAIKLIMQLGGIEHFPVDNTQVLYITSANVSMTPATSRGYRHVQIIDRGILRECDGDCELWAAFRDAVVGSRLLPTTIGPPVLNRRISRTMVDMYMRHLRRTNRPDHADDDYLDNFRADGWSYEFQENRCKLSQKTHRDRPIGRTWTDEEEKELHRQEEAQLREERENSIDFKVLKRTYPSQSKSKYATFANNIQKNSRRIMIHTPGLSEQPKPPESPEPPPEVTSQPGASASDIIEWLADDD